MEASVKSTNERWYSIDFLKGVLIILVFIGHIVPGSTNDSFIRYIIYSFHMPVFIGISGFLCKTDNFRLGVGELAVKYGKRLIIPWIFGVLTYWYVFDGVNKSFQFLTDNFIHPYSHLWYILGYMAYLLISYVLYRCFENSRDKWMWIFVVAAAISLVSKFNLIRYVNVPDFLTTTVENIRYDFRLYNLVFFVFGIYLRERLKTDVRGGVQKNNRSKISAVFLLLLLLATVGLYFRLNSYIINIIFYPFNLLIIYFAVQAATENKFPRNKVLEFIGVYSLPVYIYHILCQIYAKDMAAVGSAKYYGLCVAFFICECIAVYVLKRFNLINTFIFGGRKETSSQKKRD